VFVDDAAVAPDDEVSPTKLDVNPPRTPLFVVAASRPQRLRPNQLACAMDMKTKSASNL
jgi:hypothetical protein